MIAAIMRTRRHGCRNHVVTAASGSRRRPVPAARAAPRPVAAAAAAAAAAARDRDSQVPCEAAAIHAISDLSYRQQPTRRVTDLRVLGCASLRQRRRYQRARRESLWASPAAVMDDVLRRAAPVPQVT